MKAIVLLKSFVYGDVICLGGGGGGSGKRARAKLLEDASFVQHSRDAIPVTR